MFASLACLASACDDSKPAEATVPAKEAAPSEPADAKPTEEVVVEDAFPTEPFVRLDEATAKNAGALPARVLGSASRVVLEVKLTEGKRKVLHVPITRVISDVALRESNAKGTQYAWTPRETNVLTSEGVDPEFLTKFQAALAPADPPVAQDLNVDPWGVAATPAWPASEDAHAKMVASGLQLALSHLALPVPAEGLGKGVAWEINRRVSLFGVPAWEHLRCKAKKVEGNQIEVTGEVELNLVEGEAVATLPFGVPRLDALHGTAKLRARYDAASATPIDMQLVGSLDITSGEGSKAKRFGFEVRADEDYLAKPDPRVTLTGTITDGGLVVGKAPAGTRVWFNKRKLAVSDEGDFVIGFGRTAPPRALLAFSFAEGPIIRRILHVADRTFEPEAIDGLPPEMVDLDRETKRALTKSRKRIEKIRGKSSDKAYYAAGFAWPARGKITSTYGRKRILNGDDHGYHWGIDIASKVGTKVKAPAGGVIVFAEKDVPLSGNLVILDHGHGVTSSFLHLKKIKVKVGDVVKRGQTIATLGNTGRSTGPHLDWRMNLFETRVDPQLLVPAR